MYIINTKIKLQVSSNNIPDRKQEVLKNNKNVSVSYNIGLAQLVACPPQAQ